MWDGTVVQWGLLCSVYVLCSACIILYIIIVNISVCVFVHACVYIVCKWPACMVVEVLVQEYALSAQGEFVCVNLLTSSVLRGSPSATYGCFYRGVHKLRHRCEYKCVPWRLWTPPWMQIEDNPQLWPHWQGFNWWMFFKGWYCHYNIIKSADCLYLALIGLTAAL